MTDKTDYLEAQTLDRVFDNSAPDGAVDGCYVMLWTTDPANAPSDANEVSGDSYTSIQVSASGWTRTNNAAPRRYENASTIDFGVLDTAGSVTVAGVVLYDGPDAATDNALYADALTGGSTTVEAGDKFELGAGEVTVEED